MKLVILIIVSGFLFTVGNIVWPYFNEPKVFYVPLAVFLWLLVYYVRKTFTGNRFIKLFLTWLFLLAYGNVIKQIFYSPTMSQVNDYLWGSLVSVWLLIMVVWEINRNGRKA